MLKRKYGSACERFRQSLEPKHCMATEQQARTEMCTMEGKACFGSALQSDEAGRLMPARGT